MSVSLQDAATKQQAGQSSGALVSKSENRKKAISIKTLGKKYGDTWVVKGMEFDVYQGEFFGLLGPNGAGKTTTISMLSGLIPSSEGTIEVMGHPMKPSNQTLKKMIGIVPQDLAIYPELSCRDNLLFFGSMYGLKGQHLKRKVDEALDRVGLLDRAKKPLAGNLSGGQKRRLNIAAALMHEPQVLILDEPTVGIDPQSRNHIFETLQRLNQEGMTIIYTTHYMEEVELMCERIGIVDHGKMIECNNLQSLLEQHGQAVVSITMSNKDEQDQVTDSFVNDTMNAINMTVEAERVVFTASKLSTILNSVNRLLSEKALEPTNFEVMAPSLETVFLNMTGKRLRD